MKSFSRFQRVIFFFSCAFLALLGTTIVYASDVPAAKKKTVTHSAKVSTDAKDMKELKPVETEKPASPIEFRMGIPAWASGISGDVGLKGVSGHVDVPFQSLKDHLDAIAPLSMDARYGKWGFHVDGQYVKLSENFSTKGTFFNSGTLEMEQAFANFNLNYRVVETDPFTVDAFLGGRYNYMSLQGTLQSAKPKLINNIDMSGNVSWVDPILGVNAKVQLLKPLALVFTGDVGGFGVGSNLTYQVYGGPEIQIARNFYTQVGYRLIHTDYSSGGSLYNVDMSGPQITFGLNF